MREKIIEIATAELGVKEYPANSNKTKYGEWFGVNGVAWCAQFVSWVYDRGGFPLGNIGFPKGYAGCATGVIHFTKKGQVTKNPEPGDIVFYDWNKDKKSDHTGIFVRWIDKEKGTFEAIEGNTSMSNQSNGGIVMLRVRNISLVLVFANPLNQME